MAIQILMPALSPTMTEGNLAKWLKQEGDSIESGDIIAEIETDKATMEIEAVEEGVLGRILVAEGTEGVAVNTPIALLLEEGEDASALDASVAKAAAAPQAEDKAPAEPPGAPAPPPAAQAVPAPAKGDRVFASPLARRMAKQAGLDLAHITASGPHGRIVKRDIEAALAGEAPARKAEAAPVAPPAGAPLPLGDVVLALGTIRAEARAQGKPLADHLRHLVVHGVLHLAGYAHADDDGAAAMAALEIDILAGLGVSDPYAPAGDTTNDDERKPPL